MSSSYFFFRTLLAADHSWAAVDWQSGSPASCDGNDFCRCFKETDAAPLANMLPMLFAVNPEWLSPAFVDSFEANQTVFVLPASSVHNSELIERCRLFHKRGYRFALDVDDSKLIHNAPLSVFEYLKFDAAFAHQDLHASDLSYIGDAGFGKIATGVGSYDMFHWLADRHFDLCDSHYLTARNPTFGKEPDLTRLKLLKLLHLVKEDGDTRAIEAIFREEPKLSYNLLRLVNSVAVGARTKISNFSQAIAILGRRQLQRWLQLLIYANNLGEGHAPNPLMQLAAARGRQLELLCGAAASKPDIPCPCDNAFMVGLFSLLDVLINLPMDDILKELPMHDEVVEALRSPGQGGVLSQLLAAAVAGEAGNYASAESLLSGLGISPETHAKAQVDALLWASHINIDHHD